MSSKRDWQVLSTFTSEVEARVVESFLKAQGIDVELLDTHMNIYAARSTTGGMGMRMLVREDQLESAREMLAESQRATRLEVVGDSPVIKKSPLEKWIVVLLLTAAALVYYLTKWS